MAKVFRWFAEEKKVTSKKTHPICTPADYHGAPEKCTLLRGVPFWTCPFSFFLVFGAVSGVLVALVGLEASS